MYPAGHQAKKEITGESIREAVGRGDYDWMFDDAVKPPEEAEVLALAGRLRRLTALRAHGERMEILYGSVQSGKTGPAELSDWLTAESFRLAEAEMPAPARPAMDHLAGFTIGHDASGIESIGAGAPSGLAGLDDVMPGGFRPGDLTVVCGDIGIGKTAFLLNLALSFARQEHGRVLVFSPSLSGGQAAAVDEEKLESVMKSLGRLGISIVDGAGLDWSRVRSAGRV